VGLHEVSPAELAEGLENKDFFFVNTHVPYQGEIAQTDAFIPYDETQQRLGEYPADKGAKIVVYCMSGRMSGIAAQALVQAGYTNVWSLAGGMSAWQAQGHALVETSPAP
jgi:rhodanese-related sulfurtransferase